MKSFQLKSEKSNKRFDTFDSSLKQSESGVSGEHERGRNKKEVGRQGVK